MSAPKLSRILSTIATRLAAIDGTGSYTTAIGNDVQRTRIAPVIDDVPCCIVYLDSRTAERKSSTGKTGVAANLIIEGYVMRTGSDDEGQGIDVISDIQTAAEDPDDMNLSNLLLSQAGGMTWERDEILYPDKGESIVGGRVEYSIPHLRVHGDPEIA